MDAYEAALKDSAPVIVGIKRSVPGTVAEAVAHYLGSATFAGLAVTTQSMRRPILERFRLEHGHRPVRKMRAEHVAKLISHLRPSNQRNTLKALRGLMGYALAQSLVDMDPTSAVKTKPMRDTGGFKTWTTHCIEQYRGHHKLGTRARLAFELLLGTMQRRSDVVRLGRQHIQNGVLSLRQSKTGAQVDIPVLPELAEAIRAMPQLHLTFLTTEAGKPFTAKGFGNWFRLQCDACGVPMSAHGLRKAGATRLAEAGCTDHEIASWGGWTTLKEVQRYTKAANRKRLAIRAADKLKAGTELANLETRLANQGEKT
jgi:integrase